MPHGLWKSGIHLVTKGEGLAHMPRYLIERTFPDKMLLPGPDCDPKARQEFIENNSIDGVNWIQSFITSDGKKSYCLCDAPTPEAIRRAARRNNLPIDRIIEIQVLDPYFYQ